jgi:hypothetical protein
MDGRGVELNFREATELVGWMRDNGVLHFASQDDGITITLADVGPVVYTTSEPPPEPESTDSAPEDPELPPQAHIRAKQRERLAGTVLPPK